MNFIQHVNLYWLVAELVVGIVMAVLLVRYFDVILAWLKSKNWSTHAFAGLCVSAAVYVTASPDAQQFLLSLLKAHPALATDTIMLAGLIAKYSHSSSSAGTVANARAILAYGSAPTAKEVDAADTKSQ